VSGVGTGPFKSFQTIDSNSLSALGAIVVITWWGNGRYRVGQGREWRGVNRKPSGRDVWLTSVWR